MRKQIRPRKAVTCPKCRETGFSWVAEKTEGEARRRWSLVDSQGRIHTHTNEGVDRFIARLDAQWKRDGSVSAKDIGRKGRWRWLRIDWEFVRQANQPEKVFTIERLRFEGVEGESAYGEAPAHGYEEYRIGYRIVGKIGRSAGQWTWGQFSPQIPVEDLQPIMAALERLETRRLKDPSSVRPRT